MREWRRSTRCSGGQCAEVAHADDTVYIRDNKDTSRPPISVPIDVWEDFTDAVTAGEFLWLAGKTSQQ